MADRHDAIVDRLRAIARKLDLTSTAGAFLATLGGASVRQRTVLAHLAYATNLPEHSFTPSSGHQSYLCCVCGATRDEVFNPETLGGFLSRGLATVASPAEALFNLEGFARLAPAIPSVADIERFDAMLAVLAELPKTARATDLAAKWAPLLPRSNKHSRSSIVETLCVAGILETPDHPGHFTRWVSAWEYDEMPSTSGDMRPPQAWWTRADGVNRSALDLVFPHHGLDRTRFAAGRPSRIIADGVAKIAKKGKNPAIELRKGDLVAIEYEKTWFVGVVVGAHVAPRATLPVIEFYRGTFSARPEVCALSGVGARLVGPFREEPTWRREPLALEGLELFGPVMDAHLTVVAHDAKPPDSGGFQLIESGYRVVAARNLLYLLATLATPTGP